MSNTETPRPDGPETGTVNRTTSAVEHRVATGVAR